MQDIDRISQFNGVYCTIRIGVVVFDYFHYTCTGKSLERFCCRMPLSNLGFVQGIAKDILDILRKFFQVGERCAYPEKLFYFASFPFNIIYYARFSIDCKYNVAASLLREEYKSVTFALMSPCKYTF